MKSHFRLLLIALIVLALGIYFTLATKENLRLKEQVISNQQAEIVQNEEMVAYALSTIEKAYVFFGENIAVEMQDNTQYLRDLYEHNPKFDEWDFSLLSEQLAMDIYIINRDNRITHSSLRKDIGLDFNLCCQKLVLTLDERRESGQFYHDYIDIEQKTGKIKKYSYMATSDKQYIIQLGYSLQDGDIFKQFNFLNATNELVQKYSTINEINILNIGGYSLGKSPEDQRLSPERRTAFEHTLQTKETTEIKSNWHNEPATYRYVHYSSEYDTGITKNKVLEIIYNDKALQAVHSENRKTFILQLCIVLFIAVVHSFLIFRRVARLTYLAYHDSLTGLKNRTAFDKLLAATLAENKGITALMMIDLDNFKMINDHLGHDKGDYVLKSVAQIIRSIARKKDIPIRLGGDEFVMIIPSSSKQEVEEVAAKIIEAIEASYDKEFDLIGEKITVSIGISFASDRDIDPETLCKRADIALYASKEKGKNQYQLYSDPDI